MFESESDTCTIVGSYYEFFCCPTPPENPCNICPDGATAGDDFDPLGGGDTCMYFITQAKQHENSSVFCREFEAYEIYCCPGVTANTTAVPVEETITYATATAIPEIDGGATASPEVPVEETSTYATATAIPEIDGGTATTTTAPVVETSTSTSATASPESNVAASGGVTIPGFGGFALVSAVAAVWAIGFV